MHIPNFTRISYFLNLGLVFDKMSICMFVCIFLSASFVYKFGIYYHILKLEVGTSLIFSSVSDSWWTCKINHVCLFVRSYVCNAFSCSSDLFFFKRSIAFKPWIVYNEFIDAPLKWTILNCLLRVHKRTVKIENLKFFS